MTEEQKTEAEIDSSVAELDFDLATKDDLLAEVNHLRNHARDLARKLDAVLVAVECDESKGWGTRASEIRAIIEAE